MVFAIDIRRRLVRATLDNEANKDSRSVAFQPCLPDRRRDKARAGAGRGSVSGAAVKRKGPEKRKLLPVGVFGIEGRGGGLHCKSGFADDEVDKNQRAGWRSIAPCIGIAIDR